ncbi:MAG TPA: AAA family ATPase [Candidatus Fusicatenibacter intestinigallinarum]|uniref:AAA family ATPase n=1 Tax=Candidatus Fusicatenibacter intestinigallinarum TaxID=2838598 RepID=A0A9D2SMC3_9FIRM|nr:AAA family ATPase [Candidatus Fusicatenibacter intestinigallinarum]
MGHIIAISGKGGVGKTTLCGLLIQYLCETGKKPVLAVDADANANVNLNEVLGVVPQDEEVYRFDCEERPTVQLPADSPVRAALKGIIEKLEL